MVPHVARRECHLVSGDDANPDSSEHVANCSSCTVFSQISGQSRLSSSASGTWEPREEAEDQPGHFLQRRLEKEVSTFQKVNLGGRQVI